MTLAKTRLKDSNKEPRNEPETREEVEPDHQAERSERPTVVKAHPIGNEKGTPLPQVMRARGGLSTWSILSGILVSFGAFFVLHALAGAALAGAGVGNGQLTPEEASAAGIGALVGLALIQFLAYFWGGYTAGRMARGSGWLNGTLVGVGALVLVLALGAIVASLTGTDMAAVSGLTAGPLALPDATEALTTIGLVLLASMLLGAALGGRVGAGWHTKLENAQLPTPLR